MNGKLKASEGVLESVSRRIGKGVRKESTDP